MARTSQERKRRMVAPEPGEAAGVLPSGGAEGRGTGDETAALSDDSSAVFALQVSDAAPHTETLEDAAVAELSDVAQAELALTGAAESESTHGLHLVSDGAAALPSPVLLGSAAAPLSAALPGEFETDLAGSPIGGRLRGNLDYADWSGIKGWI